MSRRIDCIPEASQATIRLALEAIQRRAGDLDGFAPHGSPRHRAWIARIDAIERALHRAIAREEAAA